MPGGGLAEAVGFGLCSGLPGMFFSPLCIHVGPHRLQRSAAHASHKVGPVPKKGLAVELGNVFGKPCPRPAGAGRLQVVDQDGNVQSRMDVN